MHMGNNEAEGRDQGLVTIDFNNDEILPAHPISANRSSDPVRVSFDAAEGDGRVWLMVDAEHDIDEPWIPIEGKANARRLAALLLAWAGAE
jgi:hypothetical protein